MAQSSKCGFPVADTIGFVSGMGLSMGSGFQVRTR